MRGWPPGRGSILMHETLNIQKQSARRSWRAARFALSRHSIREFFSPTTWARTAEAPPGYTPGERHLHPRSTGTSCVQLYKNSGAQPSHECCVVDGLVQRAVNAVSTFKILVGTTFEFCCGRDWPRGSFQLLLAISVLAPHPVPPIPPARTARNRSSQQ